MVERGLGAWKPNRRTSLGRLPDTGRTTPFRTTGPTRGTAVNGDARHYRGPR